MACMDEPLERAANNDGLDNCTTEEDLMKRIKALAVKGQNICVNRVKFLQIMQDRGEPVMSFVVRLRGWSNLCSFNVKCTLCLECTSYQEAIMTHQLISSSWSSRFRKGSCQSTGIKRAYC